MTAGVALCTKAPQMTTLTHGTTGAALSVLTGRPIWEGVLFSLLPDIDHLFFIRTWRFREGGFFNARSFMHELLGLSILFVVGAGAALLGQEWGPFFILCVAFHYFIDFINGKSIPYKRIKPEPALIDFGKNWNLRIVQEVSLNLVYLSIFFKVW